MAQIIKHRRGSITQLKDVTARVSELVFATGSIGDLNGPFVFVGETEGVAGAYRPVSKIYQGLTAPTITIGSHGSLIDGTPFYASGDKTLYILNKDGNVDIDLTGNIEGNTITSVTITNLTGTTATIQNISGSFTGSGIGLYDIPASGITGLELNRISEGAATASITVADGFRVNTNGEFTGSLIVTNDITASNMLLTGNANINGNIVLGGNITIGDSNSDFVTFSSEISSSIVPDIDNAFDLGDVGKIWRNLYVNNAFVNNDLKVTGSIYNTTLTDNRIVIVGPNGLLEDDANFTFNGTVFSVGNGQLEIDSADGDIRTSGSLSVGGNQTINGNLDVNSALTVTGATYLQSDLFVSGNFQVLGSSTEVHISSSVVELDDNIIRLNAYSPFERYAGFEVIDSGSSGVSASLVWDSLNDYWMFVSSSGQSSKMVGTTAGTYGSEISLTTNIIPKGTGLNTIGDSLLGDDGTTLTYNTNKFTVASSDGATLIAGNVTVTSVGGSDAGTNTSSIVFRNSSNVLGYVSTTETTDVLDGILGYKSLDGTLAFSTVIDGGTY